MKIIFGKHFDRGYYINDQTSEVRNLFNILITGPMGLLNALERELGLTGNYPSVVERRIEFSEILKKYLETDSRAFYGESYRKDPRGVSKELLKYRDQLIFAGWTPSITGVSERIDTLGRIEKTAQVSPGVEDRWIKVYNRLTERETPLTAVREIHLKEKLRSLHPFYTELMQALQSAGVQITHPETKPSEAGGGNCINNLGRVKQLVSGGKNDIRLDLSDITSFQVLEFNNPTEIAEFVAAQVPGMDDAVVVNQDPAIFDNVQNSFGLAGSGSRYVDAHPQVIQLFKLSASLFLDPVNVYHLLAYLQTGIHPVPSEIRSGLLRVIEEHGGVRNEHWEKVLNQFDRENDKTTQALIDFLYLDIQEAEGIEYDKIMKYYNILGSWASQQRVMQDDANNLLKVQFGHLKSLCSSLATALRTTGKDLVTSPDLMNLIEEVYEGLEIPNYAAQRASVPLYQTPGQLQDRPGHLVWMDFFNTGLIPSFYGFLGEGEEKILKAKKCWIWGALEQSRVMLEEFVQGVLLTGNRLSLMYAKKAGDEVTEEHPMMSLLRSGISNIEYFMVNGTEILEEGSFERYGWTIPETGEIIRTNLPEKQATLQIENGSLIPERRVESASSLETLVQYPFDWVFHYAGEISQANTFQLDEVQTTLGNIAHKYIERLFTLSGFDLDTAMGMMSEYERLLQEAIDGYGAVLMLPENRFEREKLASRLRISVINLFDILKINQLKVVAVEKNVKESVNGLGGRVAEGYIDLVAENRSGDPFIFDLKWTLKDRRYRDKLYEGKHIQLSLYKSLLAAAESKNVRGVGYYLLSHGKLLIPSNHHLEGEHVSPIPCPHQEESVIQQLHNSYNFRFDQISQGEIEEAEEMEAGQLEYHRQQEELGLLPLDINSNREKKKNYYSAFKSFKGGLQ